VFRCHGFRTSCVQTKLVGPNWVFIAEHPDRRKRIDVGCDDSLEPQIAWGADLRSFGAMILCPLVGYGFLSLALRSRVILEGDRLTSIVFGQDSAQIAKIVPLRDKGEPSC